MQPFFVFCFFSYYSEHPGEVEVHLCAYFINEGQTQGEFGNMAGFY